MLRMGKLSGHSILMDMNKGKGKYFNNKEIIEKNDFYSVVGSPEGYIQALNELGAVFTKPAAYKDQIIFTCADGNVYSLKKK